MRSLFSHPIPHCANSVLYVDDTIRLKVGGYDSAFLLTCGLTGIAKVFSGTKHITSEDTVKILLEESFYMYGDPKVIDSDREVHIHSDNGSYRRIMRSLDALLSTAIFQTHKSNALCERQICLRKENVSVWCNNESTNDWVRLLPKIYLKMNSKESFSTGYLPNELLLGRLVWFLHAPYPEDSYSTLGWWLKEQDAKMPRPYSGLSGSVRGPKRTSHTTSNCPKQRLGTNALPAVNPPT